MSVGQCANLLIAQAVELSTCQFTDLSFCLAGCVSGRPGISAVARCRAWLTCRGLEGTLVTLGTSAVAISTAGLTCGRLGETLVAPGASAVAIYLFLYICIYIYIYIYGLSVMRDWRRAAGGEVG